MPDIFVHIPEAALREAVLEQIKARKINEPRLVDAAQAFGMLTSGGRNAFFILDESALDKKMTALLRGLTEDLEKPIVLILGDKSGSDGATETFTKPLRLGHLITRINYYLQAAPLLRNKPVIFGPYKLEPQFRHVRSVHNPDPIRLTEKETALLVFLAHSKQPATRQDILASVWGYDERIDTHTLETHIYQLRRKLEYEGGNWLVNEAGAYTLRGRQE